MTEAPPGGWKKHLYLGYLLLAGLIGSLEALTSLDASSVSEPDISSQISVTKVAAS